MTSPRRRAAAVVLLCLIASSARAGEIARADVAILGLSLEVKDTSVTTSAGIGVSIQTAFNRLMNEAAQSAPGLSVAAELTGPGLDAPIPIVGLPGQKLQVPALQQPGDYTVQNVRLLSNGAFVQQATPSFAVIHVVNVLSTAVSVRQLSPDEIRARGISIDGRNFDVYEFRVLLGIEGQQVEVPFPVIVDRRTHEAIVPPSANGYNLPPLGTVKPPRLDPPQTVAAVLAEEIPAGGGSTAPPSGGGAEAARVRPSIPVAIVIPSGFGVLHQYFAVIVNVSNSAPAGSSISLDNITATLDAPLALRVAKTAPAVAIGQAVPVVLPNGGTLLVAEARASAEWTLEALRPGTHTIGLQIHATYKNAGQPDVPLKGTAQAVVVVTDPRFQINFTHPDTVREGEEYIAYAFITNLSSGSQTVALDTADIPLCSSGTFNQNICRASGPDTAQFSIAPGQTEAVPYHLVSHITGHVFATAGTADDPISIRVGLTMGVSALGVPLSPATLVLPHYAQYLDPALVSAMMPLLGGGYSLATAPLNDKTALLPRVIRSDVFQRAQDLARAGERLFIARHDPSKPVPSEDRDALVHLSLDLLGNIERTNQIAIAPDLKEWDQYRRLDASGRAAEAAMARQLERVGLDGGTSMTQFAGDFASITAHRAPYLLALVHGAPVGGVPRPYALGLAALSGSGAGAGSVSVPAEVAGAPSPSMPYAALTGFNSANETGELAIVGRWQESVRVSILAAGPAFTVDLIYPDASGMLRTSFNVTGAQSGKPVTFTIERGNRTIVVSGADAVVPLVDPVALPPLRIEAAAQDLHLDDGGHVVSILLNRPVTASDATNLRDLFALTTSVPAANGYTVTRQNGAQGIVIPGAALQPDGRIINSSFDKSLSTNATYAIGIGPAGPNAVTDPASRQPFAGTVVPRIDNDRLGGIVYGQLLRGDGTPVPQTAVQLTADSDQFDQTLGDGTFLFEYIPRDLDRGLSGNYSLAATTADGKFASLHGTIRTPGEVQHVNLVFLGRGSAQGSVRYSDGTILPNAAVAIGSTVYGELHRGATDAAGRYLIGDLPVGPLTFSVSDAAGNVAYAANQIRTPGEIVTQDLVIQRRELAGTGTVRIVVKRSDRDPADPTALVAGAHAGVYAQGYGLTDGFTDSNGRIEFTRVPAGFISILASEFGLTRESAGVDLDLHPDAVIEQTLTLHVPAGAEQAQLVTLTGHVKRDDPADPGNTAKWVPVPGAVLQIGGFSPVTADAGGAFSYPSLPLSLAGRISVFDPATGRRGSFALPTLQAGTNDALFVLNSTLPQGIATMRVRVVSAAGACHRIPRSSMGAGSN